MDSFFKNPSPYFFKPTPFVIIDIEYKKKIERIQEDFLWRMDPKVEQRFYSYLNELIREKERR